MKQFYTYMWLREDGTPYYVGKGTGRRAYQKSGHCTARPSKERIVICPAGSEAEAFEAEIAFIWFYGRKDLGTGILYNFTEGGDGQSGRIVTDRTREAVRKHATGNTYSKGYRNRLGHKTTAEHSRKISESNRRRKPPTGWHLSEEAKYKISKANKGHKHSEETKQRMSDVKWQRRHIFIL
jgi:hypothetical protein